MDITYDLPTNSDPRHNTYVYDPYGNHLEGTSELIDNPWQFAGGFKDEFSGYYKFGTRYYDPTIGRWTQPDPSGMEANAYLYAAGNPVNFVDPTGQFSCDNNRICRGAKSVGKGTWKGAKKAGSIAARCVFDATGTCVQNATVALSPALAFGGGVAVLWGGGVACMTTLAGCVVIPMTAPAGFGAIAAAGVLAERCWFGEDRADCYQPLPRVNGRK